MAEKKQRMRYSDAELSVLKTVFASDDELLMILRKAFLFAPFEANEKARLKAVFKDEQLLKLMRKTYLPEIEWNAPVGQIIDLWMTIDVKDKEPEAAMIVMRARKHLMECIEMGLERLAHPEKEIKIGVSDFQISDDAEDSLVALIARNTLITHTEQQINQISVLAGEKEETVEETKERLSKNSAK